jgi:hypothetical protein
VAGCNRNGRNDGTIAHGFAGEYGGHKGGSETYSCSGGPASDRRPPLTDKGMAQKMSAASHRRITCGAVHAQLT